MWVPLASNAAPAASGPKGVGGSVRLGGPFRFDSEQVGPASSDGRMYRVDGTGRWNGRPGYRFRLDVAGQAAPSGDGARLRLRVLHADRSGSDVVDYDSLPPAAGNTALAEAGTGALAKVAGGWVELSR